MAIIYVTPRTPGGINGGIEKANSGDLILVKEGIYGPFTVDKNYLLIIADGKKVLIDARLNPTPVASRAPAFVGAADLQADNQALQQPTAALQGVEIRGFKVIFGGAYFSNASNCRIINCRFNHPPGNGISLLNCSGILVWGNCIFKAGANGIDVDAASPSNWVICNHVAECTGNGIQVSSENNAVIGNCVDNNQGSGISIDGKNNLIFKNKLRHNDVGPGPIDTGIIARNDENKIVGNDGRDDLSDGMILNGDGNYSSHDWIVGSDGNNALIGGNYNVLEQDRLEGSSEIGALLNGCYNSVIDCDFGGNQRNIENNCPTNNFYGNWFFTNPWD